eukprot:3496005-Pyramimonas_sp.AAC.1
MVLSADAVYELVAFGRRLVSSKDAGILGFQRKKRSAGSASSRGMVCGMVCGICGVEYRQDEVWDISHTGYWNAKGRVKTRHRQIRQPA